MSTHKRRRAARSWGALCVLAFASACGARTGLRVPDASMDASMDATRDAPSDTFVRFETCVPGEFELIPRTAEAIFLIDRSGSMGAPLDISMPDDPTTRWIALRDVLDVVLPPVQNVLQMGAIFYPRVPITTTPSVPELCNTNMSVDVAPRNGTAAEIVDLFRTTFPRGGTPTFRGLQVAGNLLRTRTDRGRARYIVLATDGGPNCNDQLDPQTCPCIETAACMLEAGLARWYCLDTARVFEELASLRRDGIFTYVIGLDDPAQPILIDVLDRMAVEGGRANPTGNTRYYSVRRRTELQQAFSDIATTLARCAYVTPSRPDDPDGIRVRVGDSMIARDPQHRNGWDWTDREYGELTFYGPSCEAARATTVRAQVGCNDR